MKANRMFPLQLPADMHHRLSELAATEKLTVTQVVRAILDRALQHKSGTATLNEILGALDRTEEQATTTPLRTPRISFLKR